MIIKNADDKEQQIATLKNLLNHPAVDAASKLNIEKDLRNMRAGIRGEAESAYEMKVRVGDNKNWMVLHDLRVEQGGLVAQIDHLIINRLMEMWVCESKHFSEGIEFNDKGEFWAIYRGKRTGVASPIEQNSKHILILKRIFDAGGVKLPTRLGFTIKPTLKSLVLVSKSAVITRPKANVEGMEAIIKNDQLFATINKSGDDSSAMTLAKAISQDTLQALAMEIAGLHRPITFNWTAKFKLPAGAASSSPAPAVRMANTGTMAAKPMAQPASIPEPVEQTTFDAKPKQKLVCHSCAEPVPYKVAKFCWFNKPRFGGNIYCVECQAKA